MLSIKQEDAIDFYLADVKSHKTAIIYQTPKGVYFNEAYAIDNSKYLVNEASSHFLCDDIHTYERMSSDTIDKAIKESRK